MGDLADSRGHVGVMAFLLRSGANSTRLHARAITAQHEGRELRRAAGRVDAAVAASKLPEVVRVRVGRARLGGVSEMDVAGTLAIGATVAVIVSGLVPFVEAYDASHFPREPGRAGR